MTTNQTISTTGFAAFSNDANTLSVMYGYGRSEEEAIADAVQYLRDNGPDGLDAQESDFYTVPATEDVSKAAGDQVTCIDTPNGEICVTVWEAKALKNA